MPDRVRVRSCVRPVGAALRLLAQMGSAAHTRTEQRPCWPPPYAGSVDRRLDRSSSSPLCALHLRHDGRARQPWLRRPAWAAGRPPRSSSWPTRWGPRVGQGDGGELGLPALQQGQQPGDALGLSALVCRMTAVAPSTSSWRRRSLPAREMPPGRLHGNKARAGPGCGLADRFGVGSVGGVGVVLATLDEGFT